MKIKILKASIQFIFIKYFFYEDLYEEYIIILPDGKYLLSAVNSLNIVVDLISVKVSSQPTCQQHESYEYFMFALVNFIVHLLKRLIVWLLIRNIRSHDGQMLHNCNKMLLKLRLNFDSDNATTFEWEIECVNLLT